MDNQDIGKDWIAGMNAQDIIETYHREQRKLAAAKQVFAPLEKGYTKGTVSVTEYSAALDEYGIAQRRFDKARIDMIKIPAEPAATSQEITQEFYAAQRRYAAAKQLHESNSEGFKQGTVFEEMYQSSLAEFEAAKERYDIAFEATKAPFKKAVAEMNKTPAKQKQGSATVALTQDQLEQIKVALESHKGRLNECGFKHPPSILACSIEITKCAAIQKIMSVAQFELGKSNG